MNVPRPDLTEEDLKGQLEFLDDLRDSGATNMFGAASWLIEAFGITKQQAKSVLAYWMDTFSARHPEEV